MLREEVESEDGWRGRKCFARLCLLSSVCIVGRDDKVLFKAAALTDATPCG